MCLGFYYGASHVNYTLLTHKHSHSATLPWIWCSEIEMCATERTAVSSHTYRETTWKSTVNCMRMPEVWRLATFWIIINHFFSSKALEIAQQTEKWNKTTAEKTKHARGDEWCEFATCEFCNTRVEVIKETTDILIYLVLFFPFLLLHRKLLKSRNRMRVFCDIAMLLTLYVECRVPLENCVCVRVPFVRSSN